MSAKIIPVTPLLLCLLFMGCAMPVSPIKGYHGEPVSRAQLASVQLNSVIDSTLLRNTVFAFKTTSIEDTHGFSVPFSITGSRKHVILLKPGTYKVVGSWGVSRKYSPEEIRMSREVSTELELKKGMCIGIAPSGHFKQLLARADPFCIATTERLISSGHDLLPRCLLPDESNSSKTPFDYVLLKCPD